MQLLKSLNLALAFGLELGLLGAVGAWALSAVPDSVWRFALAFGLVVLVIALWGAWAAPASPLRLGMPWLYVFKIGLFAAGVVALVAARHPAWGAALGGLAALNLLLAWAWGQE